MEEEIRMLILNDLKRIKNWCEGEKSSLQYLVVETIKQKRTFFLNLAFLSSAFIGIIVPASLNSGLVIQRDLIYFGALSFLLVIIFSLGYLRCLLDKEANQLGKQIKRINDIFDIQILGYNKAFKKLVSGETLSSSDTESLIQELRKSGLKLKNMANNQIENFEIKMETKSLEEMDYTGEFLMLFFIIGASLTILSFTNIALYWWHWIIAIIFLAIVTFFIPYDIIFISLGKPIELIKNRKLKDIFKGEH